MFVGFPIGGFAFTTILSVSLSMHLTVNGCIAVNSFPPQPADSHYIEYDQRSLHRKTTEDFLVIELTDQDNNREAEHPVKRQTEGKRLQQTRQQRKRRELTGEKGHSGVIKLADG